MDNNQPINQTEAVETTMVSEPIVQPETMDMQTPSASETPKKNWMKIVLISLVVILLLAGIGFGVWYFFFRDKGTTTNTNNTTTNTTTTDTTGTTTGPDPKTYNSALLYEKEFSRNTNGLSRFDPATKTETDLPNVSDVPSSASIFSIFQLYGTRYAFIDTIINTTTKGFGDSKFSLFDKSDNSLKEIELPVAKGFIPYVSIVSISPNGNKALVTVNYGIQSKATTGAVNFDIKYTEVFVYNISTNKISEVKKITSIYDFLPENQTWSNDSRYVYTICNVDTCAYDPSLAPLAGLTTIDTEQMTFITDAKYKTWNGIFASDTNTFLIMILSGNSSEVFIQKGDVKKSLRTGAYADFQTPYSLSPDQKYGLYDITKASTSTQTMVVNLETQTETSLFTTDDTMSIQDHMWISNTELVYLKELGTGIEDMKSIGIYKTNVTTGVTTELLASTKYLF